MGKVKNLEKVSKPAAEFDAKKPDKRIKSINNEKIKANKALKKKLKKETVASLNVEKPKTNETPTGVVPDVLVTKDVIKKAVKGFKSGIEKEKSESTKADLFDDELRLGLQVGSTVY